MSWVYDYRIFSYGEQTCLYASIIVLNCTYDSDFLG